MAIIFDNGGGAIGAGYIDTIQQAYSPLFWLVEDDGTSGLGGVPPVIYGDVYFNNVYYKTITSTSPASVTGITSMWYIDIQGICQEFLTTAIPDITDPNLVTTFDDVTWFNGAAKVYVKFRNSTVDAFGVITPGGIVPVQATVDTPAVAGDGWQTDTFMVVNSALQATDKVSLEPMIRAFRDDGPFFITYSLLANCRIYPLSYLRSTGVYVNDFGQHPIIACKSAFSGAGSMNVRLVLFFAERSGGLFSVAAPVTLFFTMVENAIYYLPVGPQNWIATLPGLLATFTNPAILYYRVGIMPAIGMGLGFNLIYMSPKFYINAFDGLTPGISPILPADLNPALLKPTPKHTRIYFQNYLGHFDQINFVERISTHKTNSLPVESTLQPFGGSSTKSNQSLARNNTRGNDYHTVTGIFTEDQLPFITQLQDSNKAYIDFNNPIDVDDNVVRLMLPVVLIDTEIIIMQWEDRYEYRVSFKYMMSNESKVTRR